MIINTLASLNSAVLQRMGIHFIILGKVGKVETTKVNETMGGWRSRKERNGRR